MGDIFDGIWMGKRTVVKGESDNSKLVEADIKAAAKEGKLKPHKPLPNRGAAVFLVGVGAVMLMVLSPALGIVFMVAGAAMLALGLAGIKIELD